MQEKQGTVLRGKEFKCVADREDNDKNSSSYECL